MLESRDEKSGTQYSPGTQFLHTQSVKEPWMLYAVV